MSDSELSALLVACREPNERDHLSGVLLYDDGNFMQCLEGPHDALLAARVRIHASSTHHDIHELMDEAIGERSFGTWTMGLARPARSEWLTLATADWKSRVAGAASEISVSPALGLLQQFWQNGRRAS